MFRERRISFALIAIGAGITIASCRGGTTRAVLLSDSGAAAGGTAATDEPASDEPAAPLVTATELGRSVALGVWHVAAGEGADFAVYSNVQSLNGTLERVVSNAERAVIVFHDASRDAVGNAKSMAAALATSPNDSTLAKTLLLAPNYMADVGQWPSGQRPAHPLSWASNSYFEGGNADGGGPSSYAVVDAMLARLAERTAYPLLRLVTLVGHSAGGQTAQLYTVAMGPKSRLGSASYPFELRTVVANPSSYPYPDDQRPTQGGFAAAATASCPGVNAWKYGLTEIPSSVASGTAHDLAAAVAARYVTYALGEQDNNANDSSMDHSCEAEAQGATRLVRGQKYYEHLKALFAQSPHNLCLVAGVGHDTDAMLKSSCVTDVLFRALP